MLLWDKNPTKQVEVFRMALKNIWIVAGTTTLIILVLGKVATNAFEILRLRIKNTIYLEEIFDL